MQSKKRKTTDIRKDILDAIEGAFPDDIIKMSICFDESYLYNIYMLSSS